MQRLKILFAFRQSFSKRLPKQLFIKFYIEMNQRKQVRHFEDINDPSSAFPSKGRPAANGNGFGLF
jgi:hypothetical protein